MSVATRLRIASFDAGGARSISQLEIMKSIMDEASRMRYNDKVILPCEEFDMIGGTDTGGLIAIMLTKLRMSVDEAITELKIIIENVYTNELEPAERTRRLKGCIEGLLIKRNLPVDLGMGQEDLKWTNSSLGFVITERMSDGCKLSLKTLWPRHDSGAITVVEAVLATCASQPDFLPVSLDWDPDGPHQYISPRASNPIHHVITEGLTIDYERPGESILLLSIGSGNSGMIPSTRSHYSDHSPPYEQQKDMAKDERAHRIHEEIEQVGSYFRFSLDPEMKPRDLEVDIKEIGRTVAQTGVYLRNPHTVQRIKDYVNVMTDESTAETLAMSHYTAGRYDLAYKLEVWVWRERNRRFGIAHPDTIRATENRVLIQIELSNWFGAGVAQWEVVRQLRMALRMEHPRTIQATVILAAIYSEVEGDGWDKAGKVQLEILEQKRGILGDDHVGTILAAVTLASTYHMQGRWSEAKRLRLEILERRRRILGENHPDTILAAESLDATLIAPEEAKAARLWELTLKGAPEQSAKRPFEATVDALSDALSTSGRAWDLGSDSGPGEKGGQSSSAALETSVDYPPTIKERQRIIEAVHRWYHEAGPIMKGIEEGTTPWSTTHSYCIELVPLNFELPEKSMTVDRKSTLSQIGFQLYVSNTAAVLPVALEQIPGPFPRWRIPDVNSRIPRGLQKIYVVDVNKPFTLALVRDVDEDFPLLLPLASFATSATSVGDLISACLHGRANTWASIRLLSSPSDIQSVPCEVIQKEIKGVYSTTMFVLLNDDPLSYKFRNDHDPPSPLPLKMAFLQCQRLVDTASHTDALALQAVHLSRALLHLIIRLAEVVDLSSMEEMIETHHISRLRKLVFKLKSIFTDIEGLTDATFEATRASLVRFYDEICEEQPGVVAVRQSFGSLQSLAVLDLRNQGRSSEILDMTLTIQEEDYPAQDLGFIHDATSEQPSRSNDTASPDSLSSSEHESDTSLERKAGVGDT